MLLLAAHPELDHHDTGGRHPERPARIPAALEGIDQVLLLSSPDPKQVELQGNLVDAAKKAGIRHIVKFSAMTADPNSASLFPRWNLNEGRKLLLGQRGLHEFEIDGIPGQ